MRVELPHPVFNYPAKIANVNYVNGARNRMVIVCIQHDIAAGASGSNATLKDVTVFPGTILAASSSENMNAAGILRREVATVTALIESNATYVLDSSISGGATQTIISWCEVDL